MEAVFLVASQKQGRVDVVALGFDASESVAVVKRDAANALAVHPQLPIIYVATLNDGGAITSVDLRSGASSEVTGVKEVPCFLLLADDVGGDGEPSFLLSANYGDGTLSAIRLMDGHVADVASSVSFGFDGRPGVDPTRQDGSHPHWVGRNGDLLVTDLGNDAIHEVAMHGGKLVNRGIHRRLPVGSGPRHMCRDSTGGSGSVTSCPTAWHDLVRMPSPSRHRATAGYPTPLNATTWATSPTNRRPTWWSPPTGTCTHSESSPAAATA